MKKHKSMKRVLMKGNINQAKKIVVSLPGGRMHFEDGTSAEQTTPKLEPVRIGRAYTLFLMENDTDPSAFMLLGDRKACLILKTARASNHMPGWRIQ
jgi:hypothetical protein